MGTNQAKIISYFHHKGISGILQIGTVQWWSVNGSYVQRVPCCASKWYLGILMVFRSKCWGLCWVIILVRILMMIICSNNNIYIYTPKIIMTHSNNDTDKNNDDDSNDIQDRSTVNQQFGHGNGHVDRGYSPVPTHYIYIYIDLDFPNTTKKWLKC